jgi:murein DD-endopeptidase MepM/ murein hydrolase activator NlpD
VPVWPSNTKSSNGKWGWRHKDYPLYPFHYGTDVGVGAGTTVKAILDGIVVYSAKETSNGNVVAIQHTVLAGTFTTWYCHLKDNSRIAKGTDVTVGQQIGLSGNTGSATTGPHLHFCIAKGSFSSSLSALTSKTINPLSTYFSNDKRGATDNPNPFFNSSFDYNTSFDWAFSTNPMPARYSQDAKYKKP